MYLRPALLEDLNFVVDVYNSTIPGRLVTADTVEVTIADKRGWFDKHGESHPLWIIEDEGKKAGWISLQPFYGRIAYAGTAEISVYIAEEFRNKGIGRKALQLASEKSSLLGLHTLLGFIFSHNQPSLNLFTKEGFETWGLLPEVAVMDGKKYSLSILGKKLFPATN